MKKPTAPRIPQRGDVVRVQSYRFESFSAQADEVRTKTYVLIRRAVCDEMTEQWTWYGVLLLGHRNPDGGTKVTLHPADLDDKEFTVPPTHRSIKDDHVHTQEQFIRKLNGHQGKSDQAGHLLQLFNVQLVQYVREGANGVYRPVDFPKHATHELVPTAWEDPRKERDKRYLDRNRADDNSATSVCAVPLKRKFVLKGPAVHATVPLPAPKRRPVYDAQGSVQSRRIVLRWMVKAMRARVHLNFIANASPEQCNVLYRNLMVAHAHLVG